MSIKAGSGMLGKRRKGKKPIRDACRPSFILEHVHASCVIEIAPKMPSQETL